MQDAWPYHRVSSFSSKVTTCFSKAETDHLDTETCERKVRGERNQSHKVVCLGHCIETSAGIRSDL